MVVKSNIKLIKSLQQKKYRNEHQLFVVEGKKSVDELLKSIFECYRLFITSDFQEHYKHLNIEVATIKELTQMSSLKNPPGVLGVFHMPKQLPISYKGWSVVLDDIRDPGNLGTIIRLCDWFGVKQLICSKQTVDCYNPKTLQATMGSISRVAIHYVDLVEELSDVKLPLFGAFMEGTSVYNTKLPNEGLLLMGNEANGISEALQKLVTDKIGIPSHEGSSTESLNVAMATGILLSEIRRDS